MGKTSGGEPSTSATHAHDPHGNQPTLPQQHADGTVLSPSAVASREIFQGLFKDLGKQAMAMESILRLVCGKVDKLENWVTEMSYGMTELDLKLRNIAHNIEGTAANVDDDPSASRWAVPQEDEDVQTATVVKKVGVGLHKKKQMRMTGMVANILDQLTTVTEAPTAAESENESHKGDDKRKTTKGKAAKKAKASGAVSPLSASSTATTPRAMDAKSSKTKTHKTKTHSKHHAKVSEATSEAVAEAGVEVMDDKKPMPHEAAVAAEDLRSTLQEQTHVEAADVSMGVSTEQADDHSNEDLVVAGETWPAQTRTDDREDVETASAQAPDELENAGGREPEEAPMEQTLPKVNGDRALEDGMPVAVVEPLAAFDSNPHMVDKPQVSSTEGPRSQREIERDDMLVEPRRDPPIETLSSPAQPTVNELDHETEGKTGGHDETTETLVSPEAQRALPANDTAPRTSIAIETPTAFPPAVVCSPNGPAQAQTQPQKVPIAALVTVTEKASDAPPPVLGLSPPLEDVATLQSVPTRIDPAPPRDQSPHLIKSASTKVRRGTSEATHDTTQIPTSPSKKGSRRASIRKSIAQRQPSIKKKQPSPLEEHTSSVPPVALATGKPAVFEPIVANASANASSNVVSPKASTTSASVVVTSQEQSSPIFSHDTDALETNDNDDCSDDDDDDDEDDDDDGDEDDDDDSDSDGSVLDLNAKSSSTTTAPTAAEKRRTLKMTRTLTALNKLKKADVLTPEEIAELKQRATQKWFKLRDHVREKNKKDVANILLKRKKNIFTVSNRIELLEEKSREVYASIKQLNMDLKSKVEMATFDGLRRHVHDIHASLQVLDDKITKGNTPAMDHIKQLAKDTEAMRLLFLEQLTLAHEHCDGRHRETITLFEDHWQRVVAIESSIHEKLATLAAEYDDQLHDLPDYTDALEGIRRAIRKKADLKALRELEARLLGHDADAEDCLIRCLSCHKEVVNAGHDASQPRDDNDADVVGSPHFKRVNPGTASARVYRSNVPFNAQPFGISDYASAEIVGLPVLEEASSFNASTTPSKSKQLTPSRSASRNEESRPSPLSFIHVTATRAIAAVSDVHRPISAPATALKKKSQK